MSDSASSAGSALQSSKHGQRLLAAGREPVEPQWASPQGLGFENPGVLGFEASPQGAPQAEQPGQLDAEAIEASLTAAQQRLQASQGPSRRSLAAVPSQQGLGGEGHTHMQV